MGRPSPIAMTVSSPATPLDTHVGQGSQQQVVAYNRDGRDKGVWQTLAWQLASNPS